MCIFIFIFNVNLFIERIISVTYKHFSEKPNKYSFTSYFFFLLSHTLVTFLLLSCAISSHLTFFVRVYPVFKVFLKLKKKAIYDKNINRMIYLTKAFIVIP